MQRRARTITNHYHHHIFCTLTIVHFNSKAICKSRVRLYFEVNRAPSCLGYIIMWNILSKRCNPKGHRIFCFFATEQKLPLDAIGKVNVFCCVVEQQVSLRLGEVQSQSWSVWWSQSWSCLNTYPNISVLWHITLSRITEEKTMAGGDIEE